MQWGKICMLLLALAAVFWMKVNGVPDFLIPGDPETTKQAVNTLLSDMKSGASLEDAVVVFCEEILND